MASPPSQEGKGNPERDQAAPGEVAAKLDALVQAGQGLEAGGSRPLLDLSGVDLHGAGLTGAIFRGADLRGAKHDRETQWPDGFDMHRRDP